jgi:hypothetical protein
MRGWNLKREQKIMNVSRWQILLHALKIYRKALEAEPFTNPDVDEHEKLYFHLLRKNVDKLIGYYKQKIEEKI